METMEKQVPTQNKGAASETAYTITKKTPKEARLLYRKAKANLLNVNNWHKLAGAGSDFHLTDREGHELARAAKVGDYLRIDIPGPGIPGSHGYDWVRVEAIDEGQIDGISDWITMKVKPVEQPLHTEGVVTHFFSGSASSNFCVKRKRNKVSAVVYGRNEFPNMQVHSFWGRVRNFIIGLAGMFGFNKPQWMKLAKGILRK